MISGHSHPILRAGYRVETRNGLGVNSSPQSSSYSMTFSVSMGDQIPVIVEKPMVGIPSERIWIYFEGKGKKKESLFAQRVNSLAQQVVKSQGQYCGDIDLVGYLGNETDPVPLVMDLHIAHDRVGSSTDPTLNGHWCYPNKLDQSLNDAAADKIRKSRADYNNNPPNTVSFIPAIDSTSGRLHSEFVRCTNKSWNVPLPPRGFLCPAQKQSWTDFH